MTVTFPELSKFSFPEIDPEPEPACPGCGRCVLCGPPCCDVSAAEHVAAMDRYAKEACRAVSARQEARRRRKAERRAAYLARSGGVGSSDG